MSGAAPTLLIVDDEEGLRRILQHFLTLDGFTVETAADGEQALALIHDTLPDLVITDLMMPTMDGRTLIARLHDDPRTQRIPVLVMTAAHRTELSEPPVHAILKPFALDDLLARIRVLLAGATGTPQGTTGRRS